MTTERQYYRVIETPVTPLLLVANAQTVLAVEFVDDSEAVLQFLQERFPGATERKSSRVLNRAETQLAEYFQGEREAFTIPIELPVAENFLARVQRALLDIPYGTTLTYAQVADQLDAEGAARAVGAGCSSNPLPILVPCHRVVPASGGFGGYRGGEDWKRYLLELESSGDRPLP
ncbi:methylated-DNA--[protein]-cysteine S-methyltransferase [Auritidibacter sp. NML130574]|uniref:methylated-DNA--[protein]-cysteine S-methyltransferase n=1 Tax=Auritidibacter sp. NML130574 TaxID=2170745 RepID=UPI000D738B5B|nr:methylated-DNA--[protein]-cysteine S-methyltransferase [Auritidibacter sp. NML130574]AXR74415.1 methylated-DNA--[protein]-cysteine S-methyltransferase [Auritidibacter sp. NML130574]